MIGYYLELLNKPEYQLTGAEKMFVDVFPLLCILAIAVLLIIISFVIDMFKKKK